MDFALPWPTSQGEWMGSIAAGLTVLFGLCHLFAPRLMLRLNRLGAAETTPGALAASRAGLAGFHLGLGLTTLLLAQPLLYMALGFSWAFTAFGRIVSMLSDLDRPVVSWVLLVIEVALATLSLAFAFGFVA